MVSVKLKLQTDLQHTPDTEIQSGSWWNSRINIDQLLDKVNITSLVFQRFVGTYGVFDVSSVVRKGFSVDIVAIDIAVVWKETYIYKTQPSHVLGRTLNLVSRIELLESRLLAAC